MIRWANSIDPADYAFVLIDCQESRAFAAGELAAWYPGSTVTFVSRYTRGAALSALAGMVTITDMSEHIIVDLADILYASAMNPASVFSEDPECGGIALTFPSQSPVYSYLRVDRLGTFVEAAEKRVISDNASAGTYIFRNFPTYLKALAHGLENEKSQTVNELFFVCPLFNGVKSQGKKVCLESVSNVTDIKMESN